MFRPKTTAFLMIGRSGWGAEVHPGWCGFSPGWAPWLSRNCWVQDFSEDALLDQASRLLLVYGKSSFCVQIYCILWFWRNTFLYICICFNPEVLKPWVLTVNFWVQKLEDSADTSWQVSCDSPSLKSTNKVSQWDRWGAVKVLQNM